MRWKRLVCAKKNRTYGRQMCFAGAAIENIAMTLGNVDTNKTMKYLGPGFFGMQDSMTRFFESILGKL